MPVGPRPRCASDAGRDDSMTTSAASSSRRRPSGSSKSTAYESFPLFIQSKNADGPARVPSGRARDSTLTTVAPARASSCPHSGPAHIEDRSATKSPFRPRGAAALPSVVIRGGAAAVSPRAATGRPSRRARAVTSADAFSATHCLTAGHGSSPTASDSSSAGTASTSSCRDNVSAHQPSPLRISRVAPPAEIRPCGDSPSSAARPVRSSAASTATPVRAWKASAARRARDSTATGMPNMSPLCDSQNCSAVNRQSSTCRSGSPTAYTSDRSFSTPPRPSGSGTAPSTFSSL